MGTTFSKIKLKDGSVRNFKDAEARTELAKKLEQKTTMPVAAAELVGKIYQYIGTTDANYTNGYFYKCVANSIVPTYEAPDGNLYKYHYTGETVYGSGNMTYDIYSNYKLGAISRSYAYLWNADNETIFGAAISYQGTETNRYYTYTHQNSYWIMGGSLYNQAIVANDYESSNLISNHSTISVYPDNQALIAYLTSPEIIYSWERVDVQPTAPAQEQADWNQSDNTAVDYVKNKPEIQTIQLSTMPEASASTTGKIYQYIGTTNANYTKGYFYKGWVDPSSGEYPAPNGNTYNYYYEFTASASGSGTYKIWINYKLCVSEKNKVSGGGSDGHYKLMSCFDYATAADGNALFEINTVQNSSNITVGTKIDGSTSSSQPVAVGYITYNDTVAPYNWTINMSPEEVEAANISVFDYNWEAYYNTYQKAYRWEKLIVQPQQYITLGQVEGTTPGQSATAEGFSTTASGSCSHAEGLSTTASGSRSHAEGNGTVASDYNSHAEGENTTASGNNSHAEGSGTEASGESSHAEGNGTEASGNYSHAEGYYTAAGGAGSHAEGNNTTANGTNSHAEGEGTTAIGTASHAEGIETYTYVNCSAAHAEGYHTGAKNCAHAEGSYTEANGNYSHAEGHYTEANGPCSHAEGWGTIANGIYQHVSGAFNIEDESNMFAVIVGNGTSADDRSDALTLDWSGNLTATAYGTFSSRKYKENISDMTEEEARKILQLNPVKYNYKSNKLPNNQYGLIAEDVEPIMTYPIVYKNNEADSIDYSKFVPALIKMIQIQQKEIEELKNK